MKPGLKQFRSAGSSPCNAREGCQSYIVYDRQAREALLIDPLLAMVEDYREFLAENRLKLALCIDTATHPDHFSGSGLIRDELGCEIAMSEATESRRPTRRLADGETVRFGSHSLRVLATPGFAPDAISLYGEGLLFSGFTLLIGATGPTHLPAGDPARLWKSLQELKKLPPETILLPGHDYNDVLFSTLGTELERDREFSAASESAFRELKDSTRSIAFEADVEERLRFNRENLPAHSVLQKEQTIARCLAPIADAARTLTINVEKYEHKLGGEPASTGYVDVREESEFTEGHIPKTRNIPLSELALHFRELAGFKRIYFSCLSGRRSLLAAKTLSYLGVPDTVNVTGGWKAWMAAGLPQER